MILFKTIRWQNLLSTGNVFTEIRLDGHRTTLIIGTNGSGKSTILDAITFVLFNKPFRKVNKGQLINSITGKNLLVEIEFEKGGSQWLVTRGSKPNLFEIYKDEKLIDQNSENKDYQGYLETVLGMNQKAFSQVVILGAASFIPFMQLTVPARREVIEDLLDIQVFSDMNILLKKRISINDSAMITANHAVMMVQTKITMAEEFNKKQMEGNQSLIDGKKQKIEVLTDAALQLIDKVEEEQTTMESIKLDNSQVEFLSSRKRELENDLLLWQQDIKGREKIVSFLNNHDTCPTCKQGIATDFKLNELSDHETNIAMLADRGINSKKQILEIEKHLNEIFEINKTIKKHEALIIEYNREIGWYRQQVESTTSEIEALEKSNARTLTDIEPLHFELKDKLSVVEVRNEHTKVLDAAAILLKDGGIKSVIIKQYIPVINSMINRYLVSMDFFVDFQINEAFEETIKSRFRDEFSYESFSEGEKMRIDLAVLFAWRMVAKMRNSAATNLLIFDEVLDSSLDQYGIDEFIKIIMSLTDQENIFIISHRGDSIGDKFENVLRFKKVRGYSQLEAA
jgi:DNA repair exonuclease SbcCD ATPase subunit